MAQSRAKGAFVVGSWPASSAAASPPPPLLVAVPQADVDLVELLGEGGDLFGKHLIDLVVKQEPFFFADGDELLYFRIFFFDTQLANPLVFKI